jgi:hypothetical protein
MDLQCYFQLFKECFNAAPSMSKREGMFYIATESKFGANEISNQGDHPNILDICIVFYN